MVQIVDYNIYQIYLNHFIGTCLNEPTLWQRQIKLQMRADSTVMLEGPARALSVQEQSNRHIFPQAVNIPFSEPQGQAPHHTQSSSNQLLAMSGPVPLLDGALNPVATHANKWDGLKMDNTSPCETAKSDFKQNGHCECSWSADMSPGESQDMEVTDVRGAAVHGDSQLDEQIIKQSGTAVPQQQDQSPAVTLCPAEIPSAFTPVLNICCGNHLPVSVNVSEDCSLDVLRIIKHKPSAIVFCDYDCSSDNQVIVVDESTDSRESSSSPSKVGEDDNDDDDDDFPETLQYKEFLVSRHRRNLSRNRKGLRRRPDVLCHGTASDFPKPINKGKPEFTGSQEEEDTWQNNGKQV